MLTHLQVQTEALKATAQHLDPQGPADDDQFQAEVAAADVQKDGTSSCCIGCFQLIPSPPESPPEGYDESTDSPEPRLMCASCILRLAGKSSKSSAVQSVGDGCGVLSPLPKLRLLVKAEAKCQDQLQLLRSQQEILRQQRESLEATKRAKEEALAAERELARQRRKHFFKIQERRKREEELKFQQFQGEEHTSRPEQEASADKPKKKKPKPPQVDALLHRRKAEPAAEMDVGGASLPHVAEPTSKHAEAPCSQTTSNNDRASTAEAHTTSLYERRRQMMVCYSQDLAPLIDGRKPKRLPFPKPVAAIVPCNMVNRRQTPDTNAPNSTTASNHRNKNQQNARKQGKSSAPKITKLRPLEGQKRYKPQPCNQFEDVRAERDNETSSRRSPLSLQPPRRLVDHSSALTAEIKPVSWAYELAKDVLPQDDSTDGAGSSAFSAPLHSVAEEVDVSLQFTMFPLQHQLPNPTFPPSKPEPAVEAITKVPRWEYSAERLSSLLEKYNVSVSSVATATTAPKL